MDCWRNVSFPSLLFLLSHTLLSRIDPSSPVRENTQIDGESVRVFFFSILGDCRTYSDDRNAHTVSKLDTALALFFRISIIHGPPNLFEQLDFAAAAAVLLCVFTQENIYTLNPR